MQKLYDATAEVYDSRYKEIQFEKYAVLLSDIYLKGRILDHGCGTGLLAEFLRAPLFGIDLSFEMLKRAKERGEIVVQGDLEHLPFKDKSFDFVLSFTCLQNLQHPALALKELRRISNNVILSYLNKFDFFEALQSQFNIQEIRQAGEDIGFIAESKP